MKKIKNFKLFLVSGIALAVSTSLHAQVTIGADIPPQKGALLELKEFDPSDPAVNNATATKGFLFPRVKLTDLDKLYPMYENDPDYNSDAQKRDSLNLSHSGLTVYSAVANTSAGIQEGLYVWDGTQWVRPVTEIPNANQEAHRMALKASAPASTNAGVQLDFRDNNNNPLIIPESGTYVFAFRLYGSIGTGTGIRGYNISLREGSTEKVSSDIYFYKGAINNNYTYSILLASTFSAGTTVNVYLKNVSGNDAWTLSGNVSDVANRTSMVWWKL